MTGLEQIKEQETAQNIADMTQCFVNQLSPLKIFLFGSFADGSYTDESDYDFYIVVDDTDNVGEMTDKAYRSIRSIKKRPVDIVIGTNSRFEVKGNSRHSLMIEGEVARNGILLYENGMPA